MRFRTALFLCLILFCMVHPVSGQDITGQGIKWKNVNSGIDYVSLESAEPLQKVFALRIDTLNKNLSFYTTARNRDYKETSNETDRRTTVDFLKENNLVVAINANFYKPFNAYTRTHRGSSDVIGLAVSDGIVVSKTQEGFPSFVITKDGRKEIRIVVPEESLDNVELAVSGSAILLKKGAIQVPDNKKDVHPRTAVGISDDGQYIYFVVIDGRQDGYSIGATLKETAEWLKKVGASEGLNLDGGGSTTMVIRTTDGSPDVLNRPVGFGNKPNTLRHNANNLGVRIKVAP